MSNLRILKVDVIDSTTIAVKFTNILTDDLVAGNVSIISDNSNIPDASVLGIKIKSDILQISCQPLTPYAAYFLQFQSIPLHRFTSLNGDAQILEDGVANKFLILGPIEPDNQVYEYMRAFLKDNLYDIDDNNTVVNKHLQSLSSVLSMALYDIRQCKNDNYLSFDVIDEKKVRGAGPFDRLNEVGAYKLLRVGLGPSSSGATNTFQFDTFPDFPITMQKESNIEILFPSSTDSFTIFNINTLILNLSKNPITRITSITFFFNSSDPIYTYDIAHLGYQLQNSRYAQDYASTYLLLESNQVKINSQVLEDPKFEIDNLISVQVSYEYKNLGIIANSKSIDVFTIKTSIREVLPPIINVFSVDHAPIVDDNGDVFEGIGGISFIDPNNPTPNALHPAFIKEIPFRLNGLPAIPGQYAIDYFTGTIYVFGFDSTNDGSGAYPPLATYNYKFQYKIDQDYAYDIDAQDLASLPLGNLVDNPAIINFDYEQVLVPELDYRSSPHQESLSERIENRLLALNVLRVKNSPITNVFRIFNETSGEIYSLNRWNDDKIYFRYSNPPRVLIQNEERAIFKSTINQLLSVNSTFTNTNSLRIFQIFLEHNQIIASTEDGLGASFNSSLIFSNNNIFKKEIWFDSTIDDITNVNKINFEGEYATDYANGVVWVAVSSTQGFDLGTATFKYNDIAPIFPHLISVEDIFYRINPLDPKNKSFSYQSFDEGSIVPETLDLSDERFLNGENNAPYVIFDEQVGIYTVDGYFVPGISNQVNFLRGIYEYSDLLNNTYPINFATSSSYSGFNINVGSVSENFLATEVKHDIDGYYVLLDINSNYLSPNIQHSFNVIKISNDAPLWNGSGTIVLGAPIRLTLPGINSPNVGDLVSISYSFIINDFSAIVIDYNKGDYFVDYTYLADEILVSYEYGEDVIDFRKSSQLVPEGTNYFVSYKVGALRDALLKNFGTLIDIPELSNFDLSLNRERYRDALTAALSSFIQGPTVSAIKNIGKTISHAEPEIIESIFQGWSLSQSLLFPEEIKTTGEFSLIPVKYGNGVMINGSETISLPVNSNLRLGEGTFETWILPEWNGLDNDANLIFNISKDGYTIGTDEIFLGASEIHPELGSNGDFFSSKQTILLGTPNFSKDGIYIYFDQDSAGDFFRWYVRIIDGYVVSDHASYRVQITITDGTLYDLKSLTLPKPSNLTITSGLSKVVFNITTGSGEINEGITFLADKTHFLLDFATDKNKSRMSIFKDPSGYFNFRIFDRDGNIFNVSADVSDWKSGEIHHVATSWKLNSKNDRDEMHLFLDGIEVPNIIKFGSRVSPYFHEKFRTLNPEEIIVGDYDIVGGDDLHTILGSNVVSSSINFGAFNIHPGDVIFIDEIGFDPDGYVISSVAGQNLTLASPMPITLTDARFSVNRTSYTVQTDLASYPNFAVYRDGYVVSGADLSGAMGDNQVSSSSINFEIFGVEPGFVIKIDDPNMPITPLTIFEVSGTSIVIDVPDGGIPNAFSNVDFWVYNPSSSKEIPGLRAVNPDYSISKNANFDDVLTISNGVFGGDRLLIQTLGLNHQEIRRTYYIWSDGYESTLMTRMPAPISLDDVEIKKVIMPATNIGPANSTPSAGVYTSINFVDGYIYQPSNSQTGRHLVATISGQNVDFSSDVQVQIDGYNGATHQTQTLNFSDYGSQTFDDLYTDVNFINVVAKPLTGYPTKNAVSVSVIEQESIQTNEVIDGYGMTIKFSYPINLGYHLFNISSTQVKDGYNLFSKQNIGNTLYLSTGPSAGYYLISDVSDDLTTLTLDSTVSSSVPLSNFTDGYYQILNTTDYRSGMQNGYFHFEDGYHPGIPHTLRKGQYQIRYNTYTRINLDSLKKYFFIGSNFEGNNQLNGAIDQIKIYSMMLSDTRIGETIPSNQRSITKDFNSLKALKKDSDTLALIDFDSFPFFNSADRYINSSTTKHHFNSPIVVNENFGESLVLLDDPVVLSNEGVLNLAKEGTIEFWVNPIYDSGNDPQDRYYLDAYGAINEELVSINSSTLRLSSPASTVLSVKLIGGDQKIDYFAGGKIEIDPNHAIQEQVISIGNNKAMVSENFILQVISAKIVGDYSGIDYFGNDGVVGPDGKTIFLGKSLPSSNLPLIITFLPVINSQTDRLNQQVIRLNRSLPSQNSKVLVSFIPKGLQGDRLSLFKDSFGYLNFQIFASGLSFTVRAPTKWTKGSWHRVKASFKINGRKNNDEMRLFIDGYQYSNVSFGSPFLVPGFPLTFGIASPGNNYPLTSANITFKDPVNEVFIGSDCFFQKPAYILLDNLRISNVSRPIYAPYGEPLDVNWSRNLETVHPTTSDLYTTYLLDFDSQIVKNDDYALLKNRKTGLFNFMVQIFDVFGFVSESPRVKEILEKLISVLKPANSKKRIEYFE